jgi:hypothetical protein
MERTVVRFGYGAPGTCQQAPEIVTDRPDVGTVIPADSLQVESGLTQTADHGTGTLDFSETLVRYGCSCARFDRGGEWSEMMGVASDG